MKTTRFTRRQFLAAVGAGGVAAAVVARTRSGDDRGQAATAAQRQGRGYQVTEHVRRYYETTKV